MKKLLKQKTVHLAIALSLLVGLTGTQVAQSCAPEFPVAVMINGVHPDLPLKHYAAGRLGVIQPGWAQSYLIVGYRYLSGKPLDKDEQSSIMALWCRRLGGSIKVSGSQMYDAPDMVLEFFRERAKVLGKKIEPGSSKTDFTYSQYVFDDAFANAHKTLKDLIKRYGAGSTATREWLTAQDNVFGINEKRSQSAPPPASAKTAGDPYLRAQHDYQEASAALYADDFPGAQAKFEALTKNPAWANKDLSTYLAARAFASSAMPPNDKTLIDKALAYVRHQIIVNPRSEYRGDLMDLEDLLGDEMTSSDTTFDKLTATALSPHADRFGSAVGNITTKIDRDLTVDDVNDKEALVKAEAQKAAVRKNNDLMDWLCSFQQADSLWDYLSLEEQKQQAQERAANHKHCLERWRATKSTPWLVAALTYNDPLGAGNADLLAAAKAVPPQSPAYLTARFYLVDALLKANRRDEARALLLPILAKRDLPPTSKNLFLCQKVCTSRSVSEYIGSTVQNAVFSASWTNTNQMPDNWVKLENGSKYYSASAAVANELLAEDMNKSLPQTYWVKLAQDRSIPQPLHSQIVRVAWLRSKLLQKPDPGLDTLMAQTYPSLRQLMGEYERASDENARRFALANIVLTNYGMSPYLGSGLERHGEAMGEFDYYHTNFWAPYNPAEKVGFKKVDRTTITGSELGDNTSFLGSSHIKSKIIGYAAPRLDSVLTAAERKQAASERALIYKNHPSKFFGDAIIERVKTNPNDPRLARMLYVIVKLPRWSGQELEYGGSRNSAGLPIPSKYSRLAYLLLQKQYPKTSWAKNAPCWY